MPERTGRHVAAGYLKVGAGMLVTPLGRKSKSPAYQRQASHDRFASCERVLPKHSISAKLTGRVRQSQIWSAPAI
jgi:hypothetical protein